MFRWYERVVISDYVKESTWSKLSNLWTMQTIIGSRNQEFYDAIVLSDEEFFIFNLLGGSIFHYRMMKAEDVG